MALYEIERIGSWPEGDLSRALVIAPTPKAALAKVEHLIQDPADQKHYKVTRKPVTGEQLLWAEIGGEG